MSALPLWFQISTALATPLIAAGVALIAYQQWQTARQKLLLDMFEKRFEVFMDARRSMSEAVQLGALSDPALPNEIVARGRFLFGEEVLDELLIFHSACTKVEIRHPEASAEIEKSFIRLTDLMRPYLATTHKL